MKAPEGQISRQTDRAPRTSPLGKFLPAKIAALAAMAVLAGCQDDGVCYDGRCGDTAGDVGSADAGTSTDAGTAVDAGTADTGAADTGSAVDIQAVDVQAVDAGTTDVGPADTGSGVDAAADIAAADLGPADSGAADVGPADTGAKVDTNTNNGATPGDQILFPGCATEIPRAQLVKSTDEYQAFVAYSQDPAGTVEDLGSNGDLLSSDAVNGQKFNVPFSKYAKAGQEGRAVRVMAAVMPANAKVKSSIVTEDISTTSNVGPLIPIKMTGKVDPKSVCEAVRKVVMSGSVCPDLQCVADKLNADFASALTNELGYSPVMEIQPITPGNIGTADGQTFGPKGGVYAVVSGMPRDNCTEAIQSGKVKTGN